MLLRFYWLVEGELAGCSCPGGYRGGPPVAGAGGETLSQDLTWLAQQGVGAVLSLTETPLPEAIVAAHGLAMLPLPVPDLHAPTPEQFMTALRFIDRQQMLSRSVAVHCLAGQGRTGTVLAAYLIRRGVSPDAAVHEVRARCPGAIGSELQELALHQFAARREWIL